MSKEIVPKLRFPEFKEEKAWKETSLIELGEMVSGLTYSPEDVREAGLLVLRSSNIKHGKIVLDDNVYVKSDVKGANLSNPDDILICIRNGSKALIGKNALIPRGLPTSTHGAFMTVFRATIPKFVYQLFQTDSYTIQVNNDLGATINSINGSNFIKYKFYVPKPEEQQKIANCLFSLDELITAQNQKLEALKAHKKGLMQQLFPEGETVPKLRFAEFKDSGEWEEKTLGEVMIFIMGNAFKSDDFVEDGLQLIRMGNLYQGKLQLDRAPVFLPKKFSETYSQFLVKPLDLLMSMTGTLGKRDYGFTIQIPDKYSDLLLNQRVLKIVPKENYDKGFVLQLLKTELFLEKLYSTPGGTKQANLSTKDLSALKILFPNLLEQQKIATCLSSLDELVNVQVEKIESLQAYKKGLMKQLFPVTNKDL